MEIIDFILLKLIHKQMINAGKLEFEAVCLILGAGSLLKLKPLKDYFLKYFSLLTKHNIYSTNLLLNKHSF